MGVCFLSAMLACGSDSEGTRNIGSSPGGAGGGGLGGMSGSEPGSAGAGARSGLVGGCQVGEYVCDGSVARPCDETSGLPTIDCAADGHDCVAPNGCAVCEPGEGACSGSMARMCNSRGTGFDEFRCDAVQGMVCEPEGCRGACAPERLGLSYVGCDYYPTVTANPVFSGFDFAVAVANTSSERARVSVTRQDALLQEAFVEPGALEVLRLPWVSELKGADQDACQMPPPPLATRVVQGGAYRLRSTQPVSVYQFNPLQYELVPAPAQCPLRNDCPGAPPRPDEGCLSFSNDATLLLPRNVLTGSYSVVGWPSTAAGQGFFSVVATEDATEVDVSGRGAIAPGAGLDAGGTGRVVLDRGDVLQVMAQSEAEQAFGSDLTGTHISASKPVQVIGGNSCGFVPEATTLACDHIEHALMPDETLGKSYLVTFPAAPASQSPHGVRILPVVADTELVFEPPVAGLPSSVVRSPEDGPLDLPEVARDFRVSASHPIAVAQYLQGRQSVESGAGDPSMAVAVPTAQYRTSYIFSVSSTYDFNYLNIVVEEGATVQLRGEAVAGSQFAPIGATGYQVARLRLPDGPEVFQVDGTRPFGIVVYGYGRFTSYMYPGGLELRRISPPIIR